MDHIEFIILTLSGFLTVKFLAKWYWPIFCAWPAGRGRLGRAMLCLLPVAALAVIVVTLTTWAASDVVGSPLFILFYTLLGFAWLHLGVFIMDALFDLSWRDDILGMGNRAALWALSGGFLGFTVIYAAANIGDGPGWWCVAFAGGLGLAAWVALALLVNRLTDVFERVTVGRDVACGVRFGCYLLASGVILGRASSGDWTSFPMTVVEFGAGWPALPLAGAAVIGERLFKRHG